MLQNTFQPLLIFLLINFVMSVNHSAQNKTMISDHGNIISDWLLLRKLLTLRVN